MSKGQRRSNREAKKPKQEKPKVLATANSLIAQARPKMPAPGKKR